jgi:alkylhydroperoxidase/carboxymuconolactone decarboxylase family protein YurZ
MPQHPLKVFEKLDPELLKAVMQSDTFAFTDGALPRKFKLLIAMALDASIGAANGVKSLTAQAMAAGATGEEVAEALRVTLYIRGASTIFTAAHALEEVF